MQQRDGQVAAGPPSRSASPAPRRRRAAVRLPARGSRCAGRGRPRAGRNCSLTRESRAPATSTLELGHREDAGEQRLRDVDALQAAQLESPLLLGQHAGVDAEVTVVVEPEPGVAPRRRTASRPPAGRAARTSSDGEQRGQQARSGRHGADAERDDDDERRSASRWRRRRAGRSGGRAGGRPRRRSRCPASGRPRPEVVADRGRAARSASPVGLGHSPADRCLSAPGQPVAQLRGHVGLQAGDARVGGGGGGVQLHGGDPHPAVDRSGLHVDELHAAVRARSPGGGT